jgi:hypothetical protein
MVEDFYRPTDASFALGSLFASLGNTELLAMLNDLDKPKA